MAATNNCQSSLPSELNHFKYLTDRQVEELTGIKRQTLANQRFRRVGIPYSKVGGCVRYALKDILAHMEAHRIQREG
jgi:hypothetical protein